MEGWGGVECCNIRYLLKAVKTRNCRKMSKQKSQNVFWDFLAASQKNVQKVSGKCPGAGAGAGKMSRKYQKSVPQTFLRDFFDTFWQIENQKGVAEGNKFLKKKIEKDKRK